MTEPNLNHAEFIRSAASAKQFIHSPLPKVAFAGRSNVGKSSVINRLLQRKKKLSPQLMMNLTPQISI